MAARGRAGYKYNYQFSVNDEIVLRYDYGLLPGRKTFLFEIKTTFIMKKKGGEDEIIGSERYMAQDSVDVVNEEDGLLFMFDLNVSSRLKEYWMTEEEINKLGHEVIDFARQTEADPGRAHRRVVPIGIDLEVCTVQQEGEQVGPALERAIKVEKLIPLYLHPFLIGLDRPPHIPDEFWVFLWELERIRIEDVGEGLVIMRDCRICLRAPVLGDQISVLPACSHAFHSHCIVGSLLGKRECPLCHSLVTFDPMAAFSHYDISGRGRDV